MLAQEVMTSRGRVVLAAVADGVGGLSEGKLASGYLCEELNRVFYDRLIPLINRGLCLNEAKRVLLRALFEATQNMCEYGSLRDIKLGSTLSGILIVGRRYLCFQCGDSKLLKIRRGAKELLQLDVNPDGSINKCLGSFEYVKPSFKKGFLRKNTGLLICSDGFWRRAGGFEALRPKEISQEESVEKRLVAIGALLRKRGEMDNISAVYIKCF